jgi:hypothetical protein
MLLASEQRLTELWLKAATNPSEREPLLFQFRDALHEDLEQLRAEKLPKGMRVV